MLFFMIYFELLNFEYYHKSHLEHSNFLINVFEFLGLKLSFRFVFRFFFFFVVSTLFSFFLNLNNTNLNGSFLFKYI